MQAPVHKAAMLRFGLILAAVVIVADQLAKYLILGPLGLNPSGCLEMTAPCGGIGLSPVFDLTMVWNRGVSFGLLRANADLARWGLALLSLVISGVFLWWLKDANRKLTAIALGLVIGGAIGNVIDRIRFGAVADFLDFSGPWFGWRLAGWDLGFPWVFNVADAAITVGFVLLASDMLFFTETEPGKGTTWQQLKRAFAGKNEAGG